MQDWWDHATDDLRGLRHKSAERTGFMMRQLLDTVSPSNFPGMNPEIIAKTLETSGRNLAEGIPRRFTLNSNEILEALQEPLTVIVQAVKRALEQSPPELAADIAETGIVLTGGGALLRGIDQLLADESALPVIVAEDPLTCVARGGGRAMEIMEKHRLDMLSTE